MVRLDKWVAAEDDLVGLEITWLEPMSTSDRRAHRGIVPSDMPRCGLT